MDVAVKRILLSMSVLLAGVAMAQAPAKPKWAGPEVTLHTSKGDIVITLDTVGAPKTAQHFLAIVKSGHYTGKVFYRIEKGSLIQLGDYDANGAYRRAQRPNVPLETAANKHVRGAVALARGDEPNSGGSTFYIDLAANESHNAEPGAPPNTTGYAVFGHVTSGMSVVSAIGAAELDPRAGGPFPGKSPKVAIVITKAEVTKE
jgi:peptidyl-prolyl cis-trans isomerase A (cyclophilin A)